MEALGAVAAGLQVAALSVKVVETLARFVHDARAVAETNSRILIQVENLIETVRTVEGVMKRRESKRGERPISDDEAKALEKTAKTLKQTIKNINVLRDKIEKLGGGRSQPNAWRKGWIQLKTQIQSESIIHIEKMLDLNLKSLQLIIPCTQLFMYEEIREDVRTGFETTRTGMEATASLLSDIQNRILQLEECIRGQPLRQKSDEEVLQFEEETESTKAELTDDTLAMNKAIFEDNDIVSECIGFASFLHEKVSSRTGSVAGSSQSRGSHSVQRLEAQTTDPLEDNYPVLNRDHLSGRSKNSASSDYLISGTATEVTTHQPYARPYKQPVVEDVDVLTDHVDNNWRLALDAIRDQNFDNAETFIIDAITTAEQRERTYNFPFENRTEYLEILAFILTQKEQFRKAEEQYHTLLKEAQGPPRNSETECRLCFALAKLYKAENRLDPRQNRDDPLFIVWCDHAVHAYKLAKDLETPSMLLERLESEAIWKSHPNLRQAAEMVFEMYTCRGMSAYADTYRQRHLSQSESRSPKPIPSSTFQPKQSPYMMPPPSPPDSEGIMHPIPSRARGSDVSEWSAHSNSNRPEAPRIHEHIERSQYDIVKYILRSPDIFVDMETCNEKGQTLLLLAVSKRDVNIVRLLLEYHNKPNVKAKDRTGQSVLHYALRGQGGEALVDLLVNHGADVNASTSEGTPLHFAVINNKPRAVEILAAKNADLEAKDGAGRTSLVLAVNKKRYELVQSLIDAGAVFDRSMFMEAETKQFIKQLESGGVIERTQSVADDRSSRRDSIRSGRSTSTKMSRIFGRSPRRPT